MHPLLPATSHSSSVVLLPEGLQLGGPGGTRSPELLQSFPFPRCFDYRRSQKLPSARLLLEVDEEVFMSCAGQQQALQF